jgi:hypothetical protein
MKRRNVRSAVLTILFVIGIINIGMTQDKTTKTFQVKKGENLSVKVNGDVKVDSWGKDEVYIEVSGVRKSNLEDMKITQDGNVISVNFRSNDNASFFIRTPEQFNLDIKTSGGDISCLGKYIGNITGTTAGGDIKIEKVSGNVILTTSGGDINTGDIDGNIKLTTSGGDISAGNIGGEGKITTSGGDITVAGSNKSLALASSGGDIKVGNINGDLSVSTSGGDIIVGSVNGAAKLNTSGGDIKLASAKGNSKANSSGGDLKLENIYGSVRANTSGGKVYAELNPDGSEDSKLSSSGGSITLLIPENAKATIEAIIKITSNRDMKDSYSITSDYKIDNYVTDEDRREIKATITLNGGGKLITLNTVNSQIAIKKWNK